MYSNEQHSEFLRSCLANQHKRIADLHREINDLNRSCNRMTFLALVGWAAFIVVCAMFWV